MSTKASITAGDNYHVYFDSLFESEPDDVFVSLTNPTTCSIECENSRIVQAIFAISTEDMDRIALAWVKERNL